MRPSYRQSKNPMIYVVLIDHQRILNTGNLVQ